MPFVAKTKNTIMKKLLLLLVAPCVMFSTLSAQITQQEADGIVQQRLDGETQPCTAYAKETVQAEGFTVITATGEILELEYPCWVYYVDYAGEANGKYMIVKENSGNLLEVKTKKDTGPDDLMEWRTVAFEIPFTEYYMGYSSNCWKNLNYPPCWEDRYSDYGELIVINDNEELKQYFICQAGYPPINFSEHTLLLADGCTVQGIQEISKSLWKLSEHEYELNIEIELNDTTPVEKWIIALIIKKISKESNVELNVTLSHDEK